MNIKPRTLIGVIAAGIFAIFFAWRWAPSTGSTISVTTEHNSVGPATSVDANGNSLVAPAQLTPVEAAETRLPVEILALSSNFPNDYVYLATRSQDPDAAYFAAEMVRVCRTFYDSRSSRFLDLDETDPQHRTGPFTQQRIIAQRLLIGRCNGWEGKLPSPAEVKALELRAALQNGPAGKASLVNKLRAQGDADQADAIIASVFIHQAGYAFPLLALGLVNRFGQGWPIGADAVKVPPALIQPLLMLVGCDFGASCESNSTQLLYACAVASACADSGQELAMQLASDQSAALSRYREILRDAIRANHWEQLGLKIETPSGQ